MTNELTLSKSKINTFIECPRKFKYRYIEEITEEANKYMLLGTEVHGIAEEIAGELIDGNKIEDVFLNLEYDEELEDHIKGLEKFFKDIYSNGYEIFSVEEYIVDEEINMNGIVDIAIKNKKNNELILFDYKTGKPRNISKYKLELCIYKILLESKYPNLNVVSAGIYFTSSAAYRIANFGYHGQDYFKLQSKEDIDDSDFDYVDTVVDNLYETIDRNYFKKEKGFLCRYCFYKDMCDGDFG
ncbi:PD-(D/E)XK nuclease family protein [Methanobrevibacter ruminantium]|uniref:RecB family exonuclease n=1 Tax=Methanobrevibacter ruminantium TaxID=83816 RepID=UPI0026EDAE2D|nr:PD-(D/E)XK nuclease family protein [Methanobrevibacter ruminantium]